MLVELSKMEQRYDAVLGVIRDGYSVREVAEAFGVSRQSVHAWLARYENGGLPALAEGLTDLELPDRRQRSTYWLMNAMVWSIASGSESSWRLQ